MHVHLYRTFCLTEDSHKYSWGTEPPSTCPADTSHDLDLTRQSVVRSIGDSVTAITPALPRSIFSALRCSSFGVIHQVNHAYDTTTDDSMTSKFVGGASLVVENTIAKMLVPPAAGARAVYQTKNYIRYIPGLSKIYMASWVPMTAGAGDFVSRCGAFDDSRAPQRARIEAFLAVHASEPDRA